MSNLQQAIEESEVFSASLAYFCSSPRWAVIQKRGTRYEVYAGPEGYPIDEFWVCGSYEDTARSIQVLGLTEQDDWKPQEEKSEE